MTGNTPPHIIEELRRNVIGQFREQLRSAIDEAFRHADDVLFDWAYNHSMKGRASECIDLMRMLRARRDAFVTEFLHQFDRGPQQNPVNRTAPLELKLLDDHQVDLKGAVDSFVSAVQRECDAMYRQMGQQLRQIDTQEFPVSGILSVEHIAETFRNGAEELGMDATMQVVLFKLFERLAAPAICRGYSLIARSMDESGVDFAPPQVVRTHETPPAPGSSAHQAHPSATTGIHQRAMQAEQQRTTHTVAPNGAQQTVTATKRFGLVDTRVIAQYLMGAPLSAHGYTHVPLTPEASEYAGAQAPLLDQLLHIYQSPGQDHRRLAAPLARIGASDPSVFVNSDHPVRSLLDSLFAPSDVEDTDASEVLRELPDVLYRLSDNLDLPSDWGARIARLPDRDAVRHSIEESRKRQSAHAVQAARAWARDQVEDALGGAMLATTGEKWFHAVFTPYFAWLRLHRANDKQAFTSAHSALEDLLPLVSPRHVQDAMEALEEALENCVALLRAAGAKPKDIHRLCLRFREIHHAALKLARRHQAASNAGYEPDPLPEPPPAESDTPAQETIRSPQNPEPTIESNVPSTDHTDPQLRPDRGVADREASRIEIPAALANVRTRRAESERNTALVEHISTHCSGAAFWWRITTPDGAQSFGKLMNQPQARGDFVFEPMFGAQEVRVPWGPMLKHLRSNATRPLRCSKRILNDLQQLAAQAAA